VRFFKRVLCLANTNSENLYSIIKLEMDSVLLICWIEDNPIKFSIQTRSDISDGNLRGLPFESLIEKVIDINWNRRQFKAKIINFGNLISLYL